MSPSLFLSGINLFSTTRLSHGFFFSYDLLYVTTNTDWNYWLLSKSVMFNFKTNVPS